MYERFTQTAVIQTAQTFDQFYIIFMNYIMTVKPIMLDHEVRSSLQRI